MFSGRSLIPALFAGFNFWFHPTRKKEFYLIKNICQGISQTNLRPVFTPENMGPFGIKPYIWVASHALTDEIKSPSRSGSVTILESVESSLPIMTEEWYFIAEETVFVPEKWISDG